jgi:L-iditol 2-dehydrogenase
MPMRIGVLGKGKVELIDGPKPEITKGELLVAMRASGICGSDVEKIKGHYGATGKIGHEPAGVIVSVGDGAGGFSVGDRVFVHHHVPCYTCEVCRAGAYTFCPDYQKANIDPGGFSEYFRVPARNVERMAALHLPPSMTFEEASMIEPLGCCIDAVMALPFAAGQRVMVLGLGPIGVLYLRLLYAKGAGWLVGGDLSPYRREVAKRSGADVVFDPRSPDAVKGDFDIVVVATGATKAIEDAFKWVRRGGTINLFGLPEKGSHLGTDLQDLYMKGVRLVPTYAATERGTNYALRLISTGRVPVKDLVTHTFPLERISDAFARAMTTEGTVKVVVTSDSS